MREAQIPIGPAHAKSRIIPADAGSTTGLGPWHCMSWDHPRGCGEHALAVLSAESCLGSSPRMRGAPMSTDWLWPVARIIPADAGSTDREIEFRFDDKDHPRGCGEHWSSLSDLLPFVGSSPRMRGAHADCRPAHNGQGIIPADAGSTAFASDAFGNFQAGSSPRMRGAPRLVVVDRMRRRIIPADAGSTTWA